MKTWSSFYPDLLMHVPGCPDMLADQALCRASREFFRRTFAWREWLDPVSTLSTTREYDMDIPSGSVVVRIERATMNGSPFDVLSIRALDKNAAVDTVDQTGAAMVDRQQILLTKETPDDQVLRVQVSLMPTTSALGIPDALFEPYMEDIIHGAKHRLMMLAGTTFSNADMAIVAKAEFEQAVANKTVSVWRGDTGKTPRVRLRLC